MNGTFNSCLKQEDLNEVEGLGLSNRFLRFSNLGNAVTLEALFYAISGRQYPTFSFRAGELRVLPDPDLPDAILVDTGSLQNARMVCKSFHTQTLDSVDVICGAVDIKESHLRMFPWVSMAAPSRPPVSSRFVRVSGLAEHTTPEDVMRIVLTRTFPWPNRSVALRVRALKDPDVGSAVLLDLESADHASLARDSLDGGVFAAGGGEPWSCGEVVDIRASHLLMFVWPVFHDSVSTLPEVPALTSSPAAGLIAAPEEMKLPRLLIESKVQRENFKRVLSEGTRSSIENGQSIKRQAVERREMSLKTDLKEDVFGKASSLAMAAPLGQNKLPWGSERRHSGRLWLPKKEYKKEQKRMKRMATSRSTWKDSDKVIFSKISHSRDRGRHSTFGGNVSHQPAYAHSAQEWQMPSHLNPPSPVIDSLPYRSLSQGDESDYSSTSIGSSSPDLARGRVDATGPHYDQGWSSRPASTTVEQQQQPKTHSATKPTPTGPRNSFVQGKLRAFDGGSRDSGWMR